MADVTSVQCGISFSLHCTGCPGGTNVKVEVVVEVVLEGWRWWWRRGGGGRGGVRWW